MTTLLLPPQCIDILVSPGSHFLQKATWGCLLLWWLLDTKSTLQLEDRTFLSQSSSCFVNRMSNIWILEMPVDEWLDLSFSSVMVSGHHGNTRVCLHRNSKPLTECLSTWAACVIRGRGHLLSVMTLFCTQKRLSRVRSDSKRLHQM